MLRRTDFGSLQTAVGVNPWVVHRDKEVFGDDAESFRPDRWLKNDSGDMGTTPATRLLCLERWLTQVTS